MTSDGWDSTIIYSEMALCTEDRFMNDTEFMNMGYAGVFLCTKAFNFSLKGRTAGMEYHGFEVFLAKCNQTKFDQENLNRTCKNESEVEDFMLDLLFDMILLTQYFDDKEYDVSPIKIAEKEYYQYFLSGMTYMYDVKISLNRAILKDSWLSNVYRPSNISVANVKVSG